jgi:hypothetical protein
MCLTPAEAQQVQQQVAATLPGVAQQDQVAWLEQYAVQFAHAAAQQPGHSPCTGAVPCPTPGQVLAAAAQEVALADDTLLTLTRDLIQHAVWWIGHQVAGREGHGLAVWAEYELGGAGAILWYALLTGQCDCWESWEGLCIQSELHARQHCTAQHNLACWTGSWRGRPDPLRAFLFRALLSGALRLPNPARGVPERAQANGFRRGMLAKVVHDGELRAGPVLICHRLYNQMHCGGQIQTNDHCDCCGLVSHEEEPGWWLWLQERRRRCRCRRNQTPPGCNGLYFQFGGDCPNCGQPAWGCLDTWVWVPATQVPLEGMADEGGPPPPLGALIDQERRERLTKWSSSLVDERHQRIIRGWMLEGQSLQDIAAEPGMPATSHAFRGLVREALSLVPPGLLPDLDGGETDEAGGEA